MQSNRKFKILSQFFLKNKKKSLILSEKKTIGENKIIATGALEFNVDVVVCIDATTDILPIVNETKSSAKNFYQKFAKKMDESVKSFQ